MEKVDKKIVAILFIVILLSFAGGVKYAEIKHSQEIEDVVEMDPLIEQQEDLGEQNEDKVIQVYVTGAVKRPGVYTLTEDSRVYQVIEMAGGALDDAELKYMDLARKIRDEETIIVPVAGEQISSNQANASSVNSSVEGKVNINSATASELEQKLSGIGPVLSQRIVEYRQVQGRFENIEDIKNVSGIGDKKYQDIKDEICVN